MPRLKYAEGVRTDSVRFWIDFERFLAVQATPQFQRAARLIFDFNFWTFSLSQMSNVKLAWVLPWWEKVEWNSIISARRAPPSSVCHYAHCPHICLILNRFWKISARGHSPIKVRRPAHPRIISARSAINFWTKFLNNFHAKRAEAQVCRRRTHRFCSILNRFW